MKTKKVFISTTVACLLMAVASITFYSCKKKPFDGINVVVKSNFTTATIGVQFVDAVTGVPLGWTDATQDVTASIIGTDASKIVTASNGTDFTTSQGFLSLALAEGVSGTFDNPVVFTITAKAKGYLPNSFPVTVNDEGGINVIIPLVSITNAPEGVAIKIDNTSLGAGETTAAGTTTEITIGSGAAASGSDATTASIVIPVGQKFYTDANVQITEALEVTFGKFSATEPGSINSFPGTLNANTGTSSAGRFTTLGLISLEMKTASGKEVTSFEKPITITTGVPSGILKPDGTAVVAGDSIPYWSHSKSTGLWTYEGKSEIVNNNGQLETTYSITHLSFWNTDILEETCSPGATLNFTGNVTTNQLYYANLYDENGKWWSSTLYGFKVKSGTSGKMEMGTNKNVYILVFKNKSDMDAGRKRNASVVADKALVKSSVFNGCTGSPTINVEDPSLNFKVTVNATCGGGSKVYHPTFPVFAADKTAGEFLPKPLGSVVEGKFETTNIKINHTYTVWVYYKKKVKTKEVTITSNNEVVVNLALSTEACAALNVN